VTQNYAIVHVAGTQIIRGARTTYRIEYYYGGTLDSSETIRRSGYQGDVIDTYPAKGRDGYAFAYNTGLPFTLFADASLNVIRVYYVERAPSFTELPIPLGAGSSLSVGDAMY
jgi:hypothetical protein